MSGGHFNDCGYVYYKVSQFADELEQEILYNGKVNEDGYKYDYDPDVIDYLEDQIPKLRKMAEIMRHIDYLYSGDIGDDGFLLRVKETKAKYNDPIHQILNDPDDNLNERIANAMQEAIAEYDT
jgi:ABC-type protease/lipase transport system fused ATPase/permease subunit